MFNLNIPERLLRNSCFIHRSLCAYRVLSMEILLPPPFTRCLPSGPNGNLASSTAYWVPTECLLRNSCFLHLLLGAHIVFSTELLLPPPFTRCLPSGSNGNRASSTTYQVLTEHLLRNSCFLHRSLGAYRVLSMEILPLPPFTMCLPSVSRENLASCTVHQMLTECFLRTSCFLQRLLGAYRIFSTELLLPPSLTRCLRSVCCVTPASSTVDCAYRMFSMELWLPPPFTRCLPNVFYGILASSTIKHSRHYIAENWLHMS